MARPWSIDLSFKVTETVTPKLHRMKDRVPRELRNAARRCATIMAREVKAQIRSRSGLLAKSIGSKTIEGVTGKITALAGPRRGFRTTLVSQRGSKLYGEHVVRGRKGSVTKKIVLDAAPGLTVKKANGKNRVLDPARYAHLADQDHAAKGGGEVKGQHFMAKAQARFRTPVFDELRTAFALIQGA